jgi:hypothetical protein
MPYIHTSTSEERCELVAAYTTTPKTCGEDCSICLGPMQDNSALEVSHCKHMYHHMCLLTWTEQSSTCPMCRQQMFVAKKTERQWAVPFHTSDFIVSEVVYQQWKGSDEGEEEVKEFDEFVELGME